MNLSKIIISAIIVSSIGAASANDLSIGVSGGGSYFNNLENACFAGTCTADDTDSAFGVNLAYGFNNVWGLEVGYIDFGTSAISGTVFSGGFNITRYSVELDSSAFYLAGTATTNFTDKLSLTGRLGVASLDLDLSASDNATVTVEDTEAEPFGGLSLDYAFTQTLSLGLRFDVIRDVSASTIALKATF